jgi:hypothetical protein
VVVAAFKPNPVILVRFVVKDELLHNPMKLMPYLRPLLPAKS